LILASSSRYRKSQLQQLVHQFDCASPDIDESALPAESAAAMVERLALAKAGKIAALNRAAAVLGSDQAAVLNGEILGKPGSPQTAAEQLARSSGQTVIFETAIALVCLEQGLELLDRVTTRVEFRTLSNDEIQRYIDLDNPVDCAGSFKIESAGAALFHRVIADDPTALIGLPLIRTANLLRRAGIPLP
jgi:septum formation protein